MKEGVPLTTELKRFTEAYATMTIAVYEPLILRWYSQQRLWSIADLITKRSKKISGSSQTNTMIAKGMNARKRKLPENVEAYLKENGIKLTKDPNTLVSLTTIRGLKKSELIKNYPNVEIEANRFFPHGRLNIMQPDENSKDVVKLVEQADAVPIMVKNGFGDSELFAEVGDVRNKVLDQIKKVALKAAAEPTQYTLAKFRNEMFEVAEKELNLKGYKYGFDFMAVEGELMEALSPIGIAHFYRQLYFNVGEGVGPIEQAFTIAPNETLEVVYETVRRQSHEEFIEMGSETISESAIESKNTDEISDKVSSMIQRDSSAAMSSNASFSASGSIGVWQAGADAGMNANATISQSSQRSNELAARRLKETTKRASERITKSVNLQVRNIEDITTTSVTKRVIKNETNAPVSYGLRRVFNRIKTKVQNLGPHLLWQLYIRDPGKGLARSQFVHFLESKPVTRPLDPPAIRPRPEGGTDTGTTSSPLKWDENHKTYYVTIVIQTGSDRKVTFVSIDSIQDLEGGGKEDLSPSAKNDVQWNQSFNQSTNTFTVNIGVLEGDSASVSINYTYSYEPGKAILDAWEAERKAAEEKFRNAETEERERALREQFERDKSLITEKSKIRSRPANDLRREERYEVMNRMVSHLFGSGTSKTMPSPLEIEFFHRYFDIEAMFIYTHPSWWKPRFSQSINGFQRPSYEITADSDPAPMGSSLGWALQLDGDTRRNEFINSPWVRVCLPIRTGREREALSWLAKHIEGEIGYDPNAEPLKGLLKDMEKLREDQNSLGINGPDYVTVNSTVGAPPGPLKPENLYPIIDEFEVTIPTEGFVYDELKVVIP